MRSGRHARHPIELEAGLATHVQRTRKSSDSWPDELRRRGDSNEQGTQRDVAILIKQSDDVTVFARELAKAVDKLRGDAEELQAAIGKPERLKA